MQSSDFWEGTRESSSMRTSKNRSSRARYTCAGCATGRSGRVAVLLCFISLFCSVLPVALSAAFLFSPPSLSRSPSPFLPVASPPFPTAAAHSLSQELLFDCFITFINAAATRCYYYYRSSCRGGRLLCWSTMAPLLLAERCEF